jgi:hypothetical protein
MLAKGPPREASLDLDEIGLSKEEEEGEDDS